MSNLCICFKSVHQFGDNNNSTNFKSRYMINIDVEENMIHEVEMLRDLTIKLET